MTPGLWIMSPRPRRPRRQGQSGFREQVRPQGPGAGLAGADQRGGARAGPFGQWPIGQ